MQLQIDINNMKSTIFLELLNILKKDNKFINDAKTTYDNKVLNDLSMIGDSVKDTKNGLGIELKSNIFKVRVANNHKNKDKLSFKF